MQQGLGMLLERNITFAMVTKSQRQRLTDRSTQKNISVSNSILSDGYNYHWLLQNTSKTTILWPKTAASTTKTTAVATWSNTMSTCRTDFPNLPMGGNFSVRRDANQPMVMMFGQDEAIFKMYLFNPKMWKGPNGQRPLLPKDEGLGIMLSAFVCREYGLIHEITDDLLQRVNATRAGKKYYDEEAAKEVYGDATKPEIKSDNLPFLTYFEYGENKEGYWNYNRMVCQLEDVIDVLKEMHPAYLFVFLFDHSSGHAKQRKDGLNAGRMNKLYGGKVPAMRVTKIEKADGFLGQFDCGVLKVGDDQHLVFWSTNIGPFYMTPNEQEAIRYDRIARRKIVVQHKCDKLKRDLLAKHVETKRNEKTWVSCSL